MLFSLLSRGIRQLLTWPLLVLGLASLATVLLIWPISTMKWTLTLPDLLSEQTPSRQLAKQVEEKFGGFGTLTTIITSPDSAINLALIRQLADSLERNPLVNFCEFQTESDFYREQQFLYIRLQDLQSIRDRIRHRLERLRVQQNPLIVDLVAPIPLPEDTVPIRLDDLKKKYLGSLKDYLGNHDKTILVLEIYPNYPVNDLAKNRALLKLVQKTIKTNGLSRQVHVHFAGIVYENASTGGMLLREIYRIAWIISGIILIFMVLWFIRIPQIPFIAAIPLGMALIWTLGLNALLFGEMNLFTLLLGLVVPGLGSGQVIHLLSRYAEERRQGLGIELALESTLLGIGPVITLTSIASAIAFFALDLVPLAGLRQLGTIGGIGILLAWLALILVFPALLIVLQRKKPFRVYGSKLSDKQTIQTKPSGHWKRIAPVVVLITVILGIKGFFPDFDYDFSRVEYESPSRNGKKLLRESGLSTEEPAVALTKDAQESDRLAEAILNAQKNDASPTVEKVLTYSSLLPSQQKEKIALIAEIRSMITPDVLKSLRGIDSLNALHIIKHSKVQELTTSDLPLSYQRKFEGKDFNIGQFSFIYPSINIDNGAECRRFAADVREIRLDDSTVIQTTGTAIMRADLLDSTLPWLHQVFYAIIAGLFLLVLAHQNRFYRTLFVLLPPAVGFVWFLSLLKLFDISLNPYSAQIFPMLVGLSITGSMHLWHSYRDESTGSIQRILRYTGLPVAGGTLTIMICFSGLLFSSHPGIRSMGFVAIIGMFMITLAQFLLFPLLVGWLDDRRFHKQISK